MKKIFCLGIISASLFYSLESWGLTHKELEEFDKRIDWLVQQKKISLPQGKATKHEVRHLPLESAQHALNGLREVTK